MKNNRKQYIKSLILLWAVLSLGGLSLNLIQPGSAQASPFDNRDSLYMRQAVSIRGAKYIPLILLCQSQDMDWSWDPVAHLVRLTKNNRQVILMPGQEKILVEGYPEEWRHAVLISRGSVLIPVSEIQRLLAYFTSEALIARYPTLTPSPGGKYSIKRVVVDPGHGGKDPGAVGQNGLREKNVVLDIALRLARILQNQGIQVLMTRKDDRFIPLDKRAQMANAQEADFFISIHANSSRHRGADGFEVYYLSEAIDDNARAMAAAENASLKFEEENNISLTSASAAIVWDIINTENRVESIELAETLCSAVEDCGLVKNRGVRSANFYVLRGTRMPAVLIESGFISNRGEASKLADQNYRQKIAQTLAEGIMKYKQLYDRSNGFTSR